MSGRGQPRVLTIAGTDPLNGAGIGADGITIAECGGHPLAVPTALVEQDSTGVRGFQPLEPLWFERMLRAALRDGRPHAVKLGMLGDAEIAARAAQLLRAELPPHVPIVVDPVLTGGADPVTLARAGAATYAPVLALHTRGPLVLTPNAFETGALLGHATTPRTALELEDAALTLTRGTTMWVLAKGGHIEPVGTDVLVFEGVATPHAPVPHGPSEDVHGTGCRLSSALATYLGHGLPVPEAVAHARAFMSRSFRDSVGRVGRGRPQFLARVPADRPPFGD